MATASLTRRAARGLVTVFAGIALCLAVAGCGPGSKDDILKKAEGAETKETLRAALGTPSDVDKVGPVETWTYEASNGTVTFLLTGDSVTLRSTSDKKPDEE